MATFTEHLLNDSVLCGDLPSRADSGLTERDLLRFWSKVDRTAGCWQWTGSKTPWGYGQFSLARGVERGKQVPAYAHRLSWALHHGPVPAGCSVLHHCDNAGCVRPDHLYIGSQADNMRDASLRRRLQRPRKRNRASHDEAVNRYLAGGVTADALALEYHVCKMTIHRWVKKATSVDQRSARHQRRSA